MKRLVVCVHWHYAPWDPARYFPVAEKVSGLLTSLGGRRLTWGADRYAFEFEPDALDEVVRVAMRIVADFANHSVGIALREVAFRKASTGALCACGLGLALAEALAAVAGPGRALVDPEIDCGAVGVASVTDTEVQIRDLSVRAATLVPGLSSIHDFFDAPVLPRPSSVRPAPPTSSAGQAPVSVRPATMSRAPHPPRPGAVPPVLVRPSAAPPPLKRPSVTPAPASVRPSVSPAPPSARPSTTPLPPSARASTTPPPPSSRAAAVPPVCSAPGPPVASASPAPLDRESCPDLTDEVEVLAGPEPAPAASASPSDDAPSSAAKKRKRRRRRHKGAQPAAAAEGASPSASDASVPVTTSH